jgi:hypothetical protein
MCEDVEAAANSSKITLSTSRTSTSELGRIASLAE